MLATELVIPTHLRCVKEDGVAAVADVEPGLLIPHGRTVPAPGSQVTAAVDSVHKIRTVLESDSKLFFAFLSRRVPSTS